MQNHVVPLRWYVIAYSLVAVTVVALAAWFLVAQTVEAERAAHANLRAVAELKIGEIYRWRLDRLHDAAYFMNSPIIARYAANRQTSPQSPDVEQLHDTLRSAQTYFGYENILLLAENGELLHSVVPGDRALHAEVTQALADACAQREVRFVDLHLDPVHQLPHMDVIAPLAPAERRDGACAALVFQIAPERFLYPLIQTWPVPSHSAETLLARREGETVLLLNRLILSDVIMPVMGGIPLAEALHARGSTLPIVLLTGHPLQHLADAQPDGVVACLLKPPPPDLLSQTLAHALGRD